MQKSYIRFAVRVLLLIVWLTIMPILFILGRWLKVTGYENIVHHFHAGCRYILGLNVEYVGQPHSQPSTLYVSNHISYLDVFVLGSIKAYFIAKSEVASWPILGRYARFQNTLFFERKAGRAREQLNIMKGHLQESKSLTLFPEGTSTDGAHVEPFKSSLFEAANISSQEVAIQPVTIAYTHYNGQKMDQSMRDHYAWYADMPFLSHFLDVLKLKKVDVKVQFHPVCYLEQFDTRKACADHCQTVVASQLEMFLRQ